MPCLRRDLRFGLKASRVWKYFDVRVSGAKLNILALRSRVCIEEFQMMKSRENYIDAFLAMVYFAAYYFETPDF